MRLQDKLKNLRLKNHLSQEGMAKKTGHSATSIGYWETGKRIPKVGQLAKIADAFGISWLDLLDDDAPLHRTIKDDEHVLINSFRQLNKEGKDMLVAFAQSLVFNPMYGVGSVEFKEAMLYDGAKNQKTIEEMTAEELRRLADEKES